MSRRKKAPLRDLTQEERSWLERISRAHSEPASHVARAKQILAVAAGASYGEAAQQTGRRSGDTVSALIGRFNQEALQGLQPRHGGGPPVQYGETYGRASCRNSSACPTQRRMARRPGR